MGFLIIMVMGTLLIASAAVFFSVLGLVQTFSETAIYWGTSIEVAKLILASFLYRYWDRVNLVGRTISIGFIALLMSITSLGIYGHIITSYQEGTLQVESQNIMLENAEQRIEHIQQQIENTNRQIDNKQGRIQSIEDDIARVPDDFVTVRRELIQERRPEMNRLESEITELFEEREILYDELEAQRTLVAEMKIETGEVEAKAGPIMFVIEKLGGAGETAVFWFVLIIVMSFDPTAVALTVYSNKVALDLKKKKKDAPEASLTPTPTPTVDMAPTPSASQNVTPTPASEKADQSELLEAINKLTGTVESQGKQLSNVAQSVEKDVQRRDIIKDATR